MSDLVGNPDCWFSHATAKMNDLLIANPEVLSIIEYCQENINF